MEVAGPPGDAGGIGRLGPWEAEPPGPAAAPTPALGVPIPHGNPVPHRDPGRRQTLGVGGAEGGHQQRPGMGEHQRGTGGILRTGGTPLGQGGRRPVPDQDPDFNPNRQRGDGAGGPAGQDQRRHLRPQRPRPGVPGRSGPDRTDPPDSGQGAAGVAGGKKDGPVPTSLNGSQGARRGMETLRDYLALAIMMLAAWLGPAAGAVQGAPPPAKSAEEFPLHIIASKLEADQNAGIAIFTGQVKATYGDSILYADQLKVYFIPKQAGART